MCQGIRYCTFTAGKTAKTHRRRSENLASGASVRLVCICDALAAPSSTRIESSICCSSPDAPDLPCATCKVPGSTCGRRCNSTLPCTDDDSHCEVIRYLIACQHLQHLQLKVEDTYVLLRTLTVLLSKVKDATLFFAKDLCDWRASHVAVFATDDGPF